MTDDLPRPATPPLPAPAGAFEEVRRRARRRRGARLGALSLAALLPVGVAGAVAAGVIGDRRSPDSVAPAQTGQECPGPYAPSPTPVTEPVTAPEGPTPESGQPGAGVMPPPRPTVPPGAPDATGTLRAADGSYVRCGGIYMTDDSQRLQLVARSDRYGRWSMPCRYGRMAAFAFAPYEPYRPLTDGNHAWVTFENPANQKQHCSAPVDVRMGAPSTVTIRLLGHTPAPGDPVRELRLTCDDLDAFSGEPLVILRPDPADGLYRAGGLGPCMYAISGEDVEELRVLGAGEDHEWTVGEVRGG